MKMNKKGFTLIELLAVISMIAIVLALGFTFIPDVIDNSKEKAYNTSLKGLYKSATVYANEFLEDEDWVSNGVYEYSCVNTWWLVNKGLEDKKIFSDNSNDEYKFRKNDVIVLTRDATTKAITSEYLQTSSISSCKNTLNAKIELSSTLDTVTVEAVCKIKNTIPNNLEYKYCINENCTEFGENNKHIFNNLNINTLYDVNITCRSDGEEATTNGQISTRDLEEPVINCLGNTVEVDFKNRNYASVTNEICVDKDGVNKKVTNLKFDSIESGKYIDAGSGARQYFDISSVDGNNTIVEFKAKVSYNRRIIGKNNGNISSHEKEITNECQKQSVESVKAPYFKASDSVATKRWHKSSFKLEIDSFNSSSVNYYYGTSSENIDSLYTGAFEVNQSSTYYAKACKVVNGNEVCSSEATYVAKIDKTPPVIELKLKNTKTAEVVNEKYYSNTKDNSLIWLPYNVTLHYDFSDGETEIDKKTIEFKYNTELQKNLDDSEKLISDNININQSTSTSLYTRSIGLDGDRKVYFKVCDVAGNCSEETTYFRTDTAKPIIYIDNESDLNNNKFRFRCDVLSGLSGSVIYQDHVERKGFVAHGQDGYAIANDNNTSDDDDDYVDYLYDGSEDIYAMCTNKAGTCTKIKAKIDSSKQSGCKLIYGTMPYTNGFSDSNPCYTSQKSCGYPLYFGCDVYDGLIHYKQYIYETTTHKEFVTEEEESC